jgi:tetratricopeptide (TPR) repeat protein
MQGRAGAPRWGFVACLALLLCGLMASAGLVRAQASAPPGVALVISGDNDGADPEISADGEAVAQALGRGGLGYEVVRVRNPSRAQLADSRAAFAKVDHAPVAILYYAGYGVRVNGVDYIVPAGAKLSSPADAATQGYDIDALVSAAGKKADDVVVILEACRKREDLKAIGLQCLGGMMRGRDHIYVLAAGPSTGPGPDLTLSLFTGHLISQLQRGRSVRQVFAAISRAVPDAVVDLPFGGDPVLATGGSAPARAAPPPEPGPSTTLRMVSSEEVQRRFVDLVNNVAATHNLFDDGDVQAARERAPALLQEAQTLLSVDPKFPGLHRELGRLAMIRGDYAVAVSEYELERAARAGDTNAQRVNFLNLLLGTAYLRAGRLDEAIAALTAANFAEGSGEAYMKNAARRSLRLGEAYRKAGRADEALEALIKANELWPNIDNASAHLQLAYLYIDTNRPDDAVGEAGLVVGWRIATSSRGGLAQAYAALGQARWAQGPQTEAEVWGFIALARREEADNPDIAKLVAVLPPFAARPVFRNRPKLPAAFDVIEDQAQSCYEAGQLNPYLDSIRRQTDGMQALLETLRTYMSSLGAQEAAYRARGYTGFSENFRREFDWWDSRFKIIQGRSNQLGGAWYAFVVANAGECKGQVPTRLAPPPGYDPRQYVLSSAGDPEADAPPPPAAAAAPRAAAPQVAAGPPQPPPQPALSLPPPQAPPPAQPAVTPAQASPPPASAPAPASPPVQAAPPPPAPKPAPPPVTTQAAPPPVKAAPPPTVVAEAAPPPAPPVKPAVKPPVQAAPPPAPTPAPPPPPPPKPKVPAGPPPPTGYELARRKPEQPPAAAPAAAAPAPAQPAPPPPPARAVIAPGILTARTVFDPLPTKPLKPAEQQAVRATMDQARQAAAAGNFPLAEQLFGKVLATDPGNVTGLLSEAYLGRGRARLAQHQDATAKEDFDFVVDRRLGPNPVLAAAAIERGRLLQVHEALSPALESYDLAVTADPRNAEGHYLRGMLLLRAGNLLSAREAFESALGVKLDYGEALAGLGDIDFMQAQFQAAADHYAKALSYRPTLWRAAYGRARALYQAQQFGPALQAFQALISAPRPPEIGATYDVGLYCGAGLSAVGKAWTSRSRDDWMMAGSGFDQAELAQAPPALVKRWKKLVDLHRKTDSNPLGRKLGDALATQGDKTRDYMSPPSLDPAQACAVYPGIMG